MKLCKEYYDDFSHFRGSYWTPVDMHIYLFAEKVQGKWWVHRSCSTPDMINLAKDAVAGPFPTLKSAKAALILLATLEEE